MKIVQAVEQIILSDRTIGPAFFQGLLNYSKYARAISGDVEKLLKCEVDERSIVVALSRLQPKLVQQVKLRADIAPPEQILLHKQVSLVGYEKTSESLKLIRGAHTVARLGQQTFFTRTQAMRSVVLIGERDFIHRTKRLLKVLKPLQEEDDLAALNLFFSNKEDDQGGRLRRLIQLLDQDQVKVVELVSTGSEVTVIVSQEEVTAGMISLSGWEERG